MNWLRNKYQTWRSQHPESRKIFVIGTGRSGTHWLGYILEAHPDIHVTIEKKQIFSPVTAMALDPSQKTRLLPQVIKRYRWEHMQVAPKHYADKSHPNIWIAEELAAAFPDSLFIGSNRDVYGTVASMLNHPHVREWHYRWREFPVPNPFLGLSVEHSQVYDEMPIAARCALRWVAHQERMDDLRSTLGDRLHVVSYEALITDTATELDRLNQFLSLRSPIPTPKVKRDSLNQWQTQLSAQTIKEIDRVVRDRNSWVPADAFSMP